MFLPLKRSRINETGSAKSIADLQTPSFSYTGEKLQTTLEVLDPKIARGFKGLINGDIKRRVFYEEEAAQKGKLFLTRMQVAWMIDDYFKRSDTDDSVLDLNEILKVEFKNDNTQSFSTRWDETKIVMKTKIAMKKLPAEEILENYNFRQLQQSDHLKLLMSLHIHDTVLEGESRDHARLLTDGGPILGTEFREKDFPSRERQIEKPASGAAAAKGKTEGQRERNNGYCVQWTTKGQRSDIPKFCSSRQNIGSHPNRGRNHFAKNHKRKETFCTAWQPFFRNHVLQKIRNGITKKFRLSRVAERFVKEREKKGHTLRIMKQGGQSGRSPNVLSYEQLNKNMSISIRLRG